MIKNFQEKNDDLKAKMSEKLKADKLEPVHSLWYFVVSSSKGAIAGSKG